MTMTQHMNKGEIIFHQGSRSDYVFVIEDGQMEVSRKRRDGNVEVIDILGQNDIFGEIGMIDGGPRSATVTALANSKVTMISRNELDAMARKDPKAWVPIVKAMSARLRRSTTKEKKYLPNAGLVRKG